MTAFQVRSSAKLPVILGNPAITPARPYRQATPSWHRVLFSGPAAP
jgi:hypothetical protein